MVSASKPEVLESQPYPGVNKTLLSGIVGSSMILFGSFGTGWLASVSALNRDPFFIMVRTEATGVTISVILLALGCWLLFRAWWRLGQKLKGWDAGSLKIVRRAVWLWSIPMLIALPIMSRDVFAYIGQGRLVDAGQDPYVDGISSLNNWFQLGADTMWAQDGTPYGPLFLTIEYIVVNIVGGSTDAAVLAFRGIALIGVLLCLRYVPKLAELHSVSGAKAAWMTVANPLFLVNFVASAHNDALMTGLSVWAVYLACKRHGFWAIVVLAASIGVKPITLVLLPFIGLLWAGPMASWPRRILYWAYSGSIFLALMTLVGWMNGYWFGWLDVLLNYKGVGVSIIAPLGMLTVGLSGIFNSFGLESGWVLPVVKAGGQLLAVGLAIMLMFRGKYSHLVQRMGIAYAGIVVLSPVIQPWYLLWLLPFFAVTGLRDDWQMLWLHLTTIFFLAYQAADQIFVWQFLQESLVPRVQLISWSISIICALYLVFLDPKTKTICPELLSSTNWLKKKKKA
ncbi:polyprenol phosphomannose-dependent alpha 1,6 mannosyltransferase MptB [Glutamicibacter sp. AOP38-B1-38]|uniref:polyprenol phosphomannose-dependent alpha 1,6 mannosyltransferase MptB n=1 Tax=Glutamicibacter sp. AOP38-B1-38 TaxID=3457680 RepID=UPI0040346CD2